MYDTVFCYIMAASNLSIAWGKVNEQLYITMIFSRRRGDVSPLLHRSLPHLWPSCSGLPYQTKAYSVLSFLPSVFPLPCPKPLTPLPTPTSQHALSSSNKQCRCSNSQFQHICDKPHGFLWQFKEELIIVLRTSFRQIS